jgi:hypothetical protein
VSVFTVGKEGKTTMWNKFRDHLTDGVDALFERFEHQARFLEWHYPLLAIAMLVAPGVAVLNAAISQPNSFPLWLGLVLFGMLLTASLWVSSQAEHYRQQVAAERRRASA